MDEFTFDSLPSEVHGDELNFETFGELEGLDGINQESSTQLDSSPKEGGGEFEYFDFDHFVGDPTVGKSALANINLLGLSDDEGEHLPQEGSRQEGMPIARPMIASQYDFCPSPSGMSVIGEIEQMLYSEDVNSYSGREVPRNNINQPIFGGQKFPHPEFAPIYSSVKEDMPWLAHGTSSGLKRENEKYSAMKTPQPSPHAMPEGRPFLTVADVEAQLLSGTNPPPVVTTPMPAAVSNPLLSVDQIVLQQLLSKLRLQQPSPTAEVHAPTAIPPMVLQDLKLKLDAFKNNPIPQKPLSHPASSFRMPGPAPMPPMIRNQSPINSPDLPSASDQVIFKFRKVFSALSQKLLSDEITKEMFANELRILLNDITVLAKSYGIPKEQMEHEYNQLSSQLNEALQRKQSAHVRPGNFPIPDLSQPPPDFNPETVRRQLMQQQQLGTSLLAANIAQAQSGDAASAKLIQQLLTIAQTQQQQQQVPPPPPTGSETAPPSGALFPLLSNLMKNMQQQQINIVQQQLSGPSSSKTHPSPGSNHQSGMRPRYDAYPEWMNEECESPATGGVPAVPEDGNWISESEKDWLIKILSKAIACENPYRDEYYSARLTLNRMMEKYEREKKNLLESGASTSILPHPLLYLASPITADELTAGLDVIAASTNHNEVAGNITVRPYRPPTDQYENSLGRLTTSSFNTPRQQIDVNKNVPGRELDDVPKIPNRSSAPGDKSMKTLLMKIETLFVSVLRLDELCISLQKIVADTNSRAIMMKYKEQLVQEVFHALRMDDLGLKDILLIAKGSHLIIKFSCCLEEKDLLELLVMCFNKITDIILTMSHFSKILHQNQEILLLLSSAYLRLSLPTMKQLILHCVQLRPLLLHSLPYTLLYRLLDRFASQCQSSDEPVFAEIIQKWVMFLQSVPFHQQARPMGNFSQFWLIAEGYVSSDSRSALQPYLAELFSDVKAHSHVDMTSAVDK